MTRALNAFISVPGSKSLTNRALLLAALSAGETRLENALFSDDSRYFAAALSQLGFSLQLQPEIQQMQVQGQGGKIPSTQAALFIGNAGTAARFLTAFLSLGQGIFTLDGEPRMRQRPIDDLTRALNSLGAEIQHLLDPRCPPLRIRANGLTGGETQLRGDVSSQFLSALLMTAPLAREAVHIVLNTPLSSQPYVTMTLAVMSAFGIDLPHPDLQNFSIAPAAYRSPGTYFIEPDASAASYFFAAPALLGGSVCVRGLTRSSLQGDLAFLDALEAMGCASRQTPRGLEVSGPAGTLRGVEVDMRDFPDTAQTLAAIAPFASSPTRIYGIASARHKETDRIAALCAELTRLGVRVEEHPDGLTIFPAARLQPAQVKTYNDHRMAMSFALTALRVPGLTIENPGCVSKTFPGFFDVWQSMLEQSA